MIKLFVSADSVIFSARHRQQAFKEILASVTPFFESRNPRIGYASKSFLYGSRTSVDVIDETLSESSAMTSILE